MEDDNLVNVSRFLVIIKQFIPLHHHLIDAFIALPSLMITRLWW
jgi:hypothetical protein